MKEYLKQFKKWFEGNKKLITVISVAVVGSVLAVKGYKGIIRLIDIQEQATLMVVDNNLKLLKDGEVFSMVVGNKTDDFARTIVSKQWTKHNGETLYLGKVSEIIELSEEERILKQINRIGRNITNALEQIPKKVK